MPEIYQLGLLVLARHALPSGGVLSLCRGSIVSFQGDCIVNAANCRGLGGGGVDGAVNTAGGPQLVAARKALPIVNSKGRIPKGDARMTKAFGELKCKAVVHAVSADYSTDGPEEMCDAIVKSAYKASLREAATFASVAFSLLSAGVYRGNRELDAILGIAVDTIVRFANLEQAVFLVGYTDEEIQTLMEIFKRKFGE